MKKIIRLTESDLHKIIEGAVKRTINEIGDTKKGRDALSQVAGRATAKTMCAKNKKDAEKGAKCANMAYDRLKKHGHLANGSQFRKGFSKVTEAKNDDIENGEYGDYDDSFLNPEDEDYLNDVYDDYEDRDMRDYLDSQASDDYGYDDDLGYSDGDLYRGAIH